MITQRTFSSLAVNIKIQWLRLAVHLIGLWGLFHLGLLWLTDGLTANPIQYFVQHLGRYAVYMLVLTLTVTPLITLTGWKIISRHRRTLGLYTFFYFFLHLFTFAAVDYGFDWSEILLLVGEKNFIWFGLLAGLVLTALAVTSFKYWMKRLGKNWKKLHRLVYPASLLVVLHYAGALKGSLTTLSGDIQRPIQIGLTGHCTA